MAFLPLALGNINKSTAAVGHLSSPRPMGVLLGHFCSPLCCLQCCDRRMCSDANTQSHGYRI